MPHATFLGGGGNGNIRGRTAERQNGLLAEWLTVGMGRNGGTAEWRNGGMVVWIRTKSTRYIYGTHTLADWRNGGLAERRSGGTATYQIYTICLRYTRTTTTTPTL